MSLIQCLEEAGRTSGVFGHATVDYHLRPDGVLTRVTSPHGAECCYMTSWLMLTETIGNPLIYARDICLTQLANVGSKPNGGAG